MCDPCNPFFHATHRLQRKPLFVLVSLSFLQDLSEVTCVCPWRHKIEGETRAKERSLIVDTTLLYWDCSCKIVRPDPFSDPSSSIVGRDRRSVLRPRSIFPPLLSYFPLGLCMLVVKKWYNKKTDFTGQ